MISENLIDDIIGECEDDHVGLWSIIRGVEDENPGATNLQIYEDTLTIIKDLLEQNKIIAGFPKPNGKDFNKVVFSNEEIIDLIKLEWNPDGKRPNVGEVIWFTAIGV